MLFFMELGLQCRKYFKHNFFLTTRNKVAKKILIIGDSVLGTEISNQTLITLLLKKEIIVKNKVKLFDETFPSNTSARANFYVKDYIEKYRPHLAIVLLGNSDYLINESKRDPALSWRPVSYLKKLISKTQVFIFFSFVANQFGNKNQKKKEDESWRHQINGESYKRYKKLHESYLAGNISCKRLFPLLKLQARYEPSRTLEMIKKSLLCFKEKLNTEERFNGYIAVSFAYGEIDLRKEGRKYALLAEKISQNDDEKWRASKALFYLAHEEKKCEEQIKSFMALLKIKKATQTFFWVTRECFLENKKKGALFFKEIGRIYPEYERLSLALVQSLESLEKENERKDANPLNAILWKMAFDGDRNDYMAKMLYYKMHSMHKEANALFVEQENFNSFNHYEIDIKNFTDLIYKLLNDKIKVLVLGYAHQPDQAILDAISPFGEKVKFISTYKIFVKNLNRYNVLDLFADDFIHLAPAGKELIADELSKTLERGMETKNGY